MSAPTENSEIAWDIVRKAQHDANWLILRDDIEEVLNQRDIEHDRRVTELLEANNRTLEEARAARGRLYDLESAFRDLLNNERRLKALERRVAEIHSRTIGLIRVGGS